MGNVGVTTEVHESSQNYEVIKNLNKKYIVNI